MKKALLLLVCLFAGFIVRGQITFERNYGGSAEDNGSRVLQMDDGGYLVTGVTASYGAGGYDIYLIKTNEYGDTIWTKTYGGINNEQSNAMKRTSDGNIIIAGRTSSFGAGNTDCYLLKIDQNGETLWLKTYGGSNEDEAFDVIQTLDSGYILVGNTLSYGIGMGNIYLIKTNVTGDTVWTKTFGGITFSMGWSVLQVIDGGFILSGFDMSEDKNMVIIKTNANGDLVWEKNYRFSGGLSYGTTIIKTVDGGYAIIGTQIDSTSFSDIKLLKVDTNGDSLFAQTYGGIDNEAGADIIQTNDDGFIITGLTESFGAGGKDVYLIKTDENGIEQWTKTFGGTGDDWGCFVQQTTDNGYIITGYTKSFGNNFDVYLIKTDANGHVAGINETEKPNNSINVSPNPFTTSAQITFNQTYKTIALEVYDIEGKLLLQNRYADCKQIQLNRDNLNNGLYFLKLTLDDKAMETRKVVVSE